MYIFVFIIGMAIPTIIGWFTIRIVEGETPVLFLLERWTLALVLGTTETMFLFFISEKIGFMSLNRSGFLLVSTLALIAIGWLFMRIKMHWKSIPYPKPAPCKPISKKIKVIVALAIIWITIKIVAAIVLAIGSPPYLDDTVSNWNMRGKAYFVEQEIVLSLEKDAIINAQSAGVFSYPPTVPLVKTWLCAIAGKWSEGLANSPHVIWYVTSLFMVYFFLRRHTTVLYAILGTYILSSLPLYQIHGSQSYADLFVSLHVFAAIALLFNSFAAKAEEESIGFLRISGFSAALLVFTKNEALVIHLPIYLFTLLITVFFMIKIERISLKSAQKTFIYIFIFLCSITGPWLLFKFLNHLPFGNAKPISGIQIGWQENVIETLWINTFFEGNWIFLFPILIALLLFQWKKAFSSPVVIFTFFFLVVFGQQIFLYLFTTLSTEALRQTGLARGLIQLTPLIVGLFTLLIPMPHLKDIHEER